MALFFFSKGCLQGDTLKQQTQVPRSPGFHSQDLAHKVSAWPGGIS